MSISERLQMVIKMNGMTNASFADKIGVQRSSISHVLAGRNKPSIDFIQKILNAFPKVDAAWLVTGKKVGRVAEGTDEQVLRPLADIEVKEDSAQFNDEVQAPYNKSSVKNNDTDTSVPDPKESKRKVVKVIVFYSDGTFEELASH